MLKSDQRARRSRMDYRRLYCLSPVMVRLKLLLLTLAYSIHPVYYRLYDEVGILASKMSFDSEDSSLGRIETLSIPPPQTISSLSSRVMKAESFVTRTVQLFQDMDGEVPMTDNDHLPLQAQAYPGHLEDEPLTIVCGQESSGKAEASQVMTPLSAVDSSLLMRIRAVATQSE